MAWCGTGEAAMEPSVQWRMTLAEVLSIVVVIALSLACLSPGQAATAAAILIASAFFDSLPRPAVMPSGRWKRDLSGPDR